MIKDSAYTDVDLIRGLYEDPANELLLAEYILQTGGVAFGQSQAGAGGGSGGGGNIIGAGDVGIGTGGDDGPCFMGGMLVRTFDGLNHEIEFMYEQRDRFLGRGALSFDKFNQLWPGKIVDITRTEIDEALLDVWFTGEPNALEVRPAHRFWTQWLDFQEIGSLTKANKVFEMAEGGLELTRVEKKERIKYNTPIYVYNLSIADLHSYMIAAPGGRPKLVSNKKREDQFGELNNT